MPLKQRNQKKPKQLVVRAKNRNMTFTVSAAHIDVYVNTDQCDYLATLKNIFS